MKIKKKWRSLGWRHPLWDQVRFYSVFRGKKRDEWIGKLRQGTFEVEPGKNLIIDEGQIKIFLDYLDHRDADLATANGHFRTKEEALAFCEKLKVKVGMTATQLLGWTDTPQALVAGVTGVAKLVCDEKSVSLVAKPDRRCLWLLDHHLHVTARNLDGAIPSLANPSIVWEIKEYWGEKSGGSKMSDAVYECNLVGRELREFEDRTKHRHINHIVFVDGKHQWASRQSDVRRLIDLFHQGIIDHLFIGREVESEWRSLLSSILREPGTL